MRENSKNNQYDFHSVLEKRLRKTRRVMNIGHQLLSLETASSADRIAREAFQSFTDAFDYLSNNFPEISAILNTRLSLIQKQFKEELDWTQLSKESSAVSDIARVRLRFAMLDSFIAAVNHEMEQAYPWQARWASFFHRHKYHLLITICLIAIVGGIIFGTLYSKRQSYGLVGTYFEGIEFQRSRTTRVDKQINFDWESGSPLSNLTDLFSIRWTGELVVPTTGDYNFMIDSDDGVRLWINSKQIIDNWNTQAWGTSSGTIKLEKGRVPIKIEYFENLGEAGIKLYWNLSNSPHIRLIPSKNLRIK